MSLSEKRCKTRREPQYDASPAEPGAHVPLYRADWPAAPTTVTAMPSLPKLSSAFARPAMMMWCGVRLGVCYRVIGLTSVRRTSVSGRGGGGRHVRAVFGTCWFLEGWGALCTAPRKASSPQPCPSCLMNMAGLSLSSATRVTSSASPASMHRRLFSILARSDQICSLHRSLSTDPNAIDEYNH